MKNQLKFWIGAVLGLVLFQVTESRAAKPDTHRYTIRFDKTMYQLESNQDGIILRDSSGSKKIPFKACARRTIDQIRSDLGRYLSDNGKDRIKEKTVYDVRLSDHEKEISIPRGGRFGTWLRSLPARFRYLWGEAEMRCKK